MALIERDLAAVGTALSVHVVGEERPARVIAPSPYDPKGQAMRAAVRGDKFSVKAEAAGGA